MKQPQPDPEPRFFITDLSALNKLYQADKVFLKRPSLTTKMALKLTIDEAEKPFFSPEYCLIGGARDRLEELIPERTWPSGYESRR
jgi:hypothetical protein